MIEVIRAVLPYLFAGAGAVATIALFRQCHQLYRHRAAVRAKLEQLRRPTVIRFRKF